MESSWQRWHQQLAGRQIVKVENGLGCVKRSSVVKRSGSEGEGGGRGQKSDTSQTVLRRLSTLGFRFRRVLGGCRGEGGVGRVCVWCV